jgi:hypothetical protein
MEHFTVVNDVVMLLKPVEAGRNGEAASSLISGGATWSSPATAL